MNRPDPPLTHTRRPIAGHGHVGIGGWQIKLYSISGKSPDVSPTLLEQAADIAERVLPSPAVTPTRYGVGFVIVHEATAFNTIVVDWWENVNELRHRVFRANPDAQRDFRDITATGEAVCIWELRVQAAEREAWLEHVLANPSGPDIPKYLAVTLTEVC